jgi:divalent metal cation (Fe/Co/Zn/Cd) transporter
LVWINALCVKWGFSFYVDLHVVVSGDLTVREGHKIAHRVEDQALKGVPQVAEVMVHVEPEEELIAKASNAAHRV